MTEQPTQDSNNITREVLIVSEPHERPGEKIQHGKPYTTKAHFTLQFLCFTRNIMLNFFPSKIPLEPELSDEGDDMVTVKDSSIHVVEGPIIVLSKKTLKPPLLAACIYVEDS